MTDEIKDSRGILPIWERENEIKYLRIAGYKPGQIYEIMASQGLIDIKRRTFDNLYSKINKEWESDALETKDPAAGREEYLAFLRVSLSCCLLGTVNPDGKRVGVNLKLALPIAQEIARLSGVNLKIDESTLRVVDVQAARDYLDKVMAVVWRHVTDTDIRNQIIAGINDLAAEDN